MVDQSTFADTLLHGHIDTRVLYHGITCTILWNTS